MVKDTEKRKPGAAAIRRLIRVDFPEPEGAEITIRLPRTAGVLWFSATLEIVTSDK